MNENNSTYDGEVVLTSTIILENCPSMNRIIKLLNTFLENNHFPKNYKFDCKQSKVFFYFDNPQIAYEFLKCFNLEKLESRIYFKTNAYLTMDAKYDNKKLKKKNYNSTSQKDILKVPNYRKLILISDEQFNDKKIRIGSSIRRTSSVIKSTCPSNCSIRASSPYIEPETSFKLRENEKFKWVGHQNFNAYIDKATFNKDYIGSSRYLHDNTETKSYQLRPINKFKWVTPKNFMV